MNADELTKQMNAYYSRQALRHDGLMNYTSNKAMEELLHEIVEAVEPLITGRDVLEIACGTGNWTQVLAKRAGSVLATDVNRSVLAVARTKKYFGDVTFRLADAYRLPEIDPPFEAAFMADWWSHMPRSKIPTFLSSLHGCLAARATVVVIDMMPSESLNRWPSHIDAEGNLVQKRRAPDPDGDEFLVVKNFPDEVELIKTVRDSALDIRYTRFSRLRRWMLSYTRA